MLHVPELVIDDKTTAIMQFSVSKTFVSISCHIFLNMEAFKDIDKIVLIET
jgi:hypothetical protein